MLQANFSRLVKRIVTKTPPGSVSCLSSQLYRSVLAPASRSFCSMSAIPISHANNTAHSTVSTMDPRAAEVLTYWLGSATPTNTDALAKQGLWFSKSDATDEEIRTLFGPMVEQAMAGELDGWAETPLGRLALILLLDQFTRNIYRGSPKSFAADSLALKLALDGMSIGHDVHPSIPSVARIFCYLPLQHAEDKSMQAQSIIAYTKLQDDAEPNLRKFFAFALDYAVRHQDVIVKYGRFPHRNSILGRSSTPEELEYLSQPGAGF